MSCRAKGIIIGSMEDLVLLPGWTEDRKSYRKLVKMAPANFRIFIPPYKDLVLHHDWISKHPEYFWKNIVFSFFLC